METQVKARIEELKKLDHEIPHKMEWVREWNNTVFFNDSKSSDLESAMYALEQINGKVVWIMGSPSWEYDYEPIQEWMKTETVAVFMFGENNSYVSEELAPNARIFSSKPTLVEVLSEVKDFISEYNDYTVLFSPACTTFDLYESFRERGDHFKSLIQNW